MTVGWGIKLGLLEVAVTVNVCNSLLAPEEMPDRATAWSPAFSVMVRLLMTASGMGALGGALYLASRESVVGLGRVSTISTIAFGAGLIAFASTRSELVALLVLPVVGAGLMVQMGSINTILQTIVEDHLRGRVMAFYTMAFFGSAPIGSLLAGVAADRIGAGWTIALCGVACVAGGLWFARRLPTLRALVRPMYQRAKPLEQRAVEGWSTIFEREW